ERNRGNRHDRSAVLRHVFERLSVVLAGEELLHYLLVRFALIPLQNRFLVLEPSKDDLLSASGLCRFNPKATRRSLQGGDEIGESLTLFFFVGGLVSRRGRGQQPNPDDRPEKDCGQYTHSHRVLQLG